MKKIIKIIFVLLFLWNVMMVTNLNVFVEAVNEYTGLSTAKGYQSLGGTSGDSVTKIVGAVFTIFQVVGTGIALFMLAWIGIKYMMAAPDEKAEIKKSATAYIVGAIILFATVNLVKIIQVFATGNIKYTT